MKYLLLLLLSCNTLILNAQCPAGTFNNTNTTFWPMPSQPGAINETTIPNAWGGDYYIFDVVAGNTYTFRTCFPENVSNGNINTVLSIYNTAGTSLITFNDDFCSVQSQVSWLATFTGQIRLSYYQSGCTTVFIDTKIGVYYTTACTAPTVSAQPSSVTVCNGSNTFFTATGAGTPVLSYQWQVNTGSGFTNITNGGVYSNANTSTLNITNAATSMSGYLYRCSITNACGNISTNNATLTVNATNNWTGAVSTDWNTPGNWSCGTVPTASDDVVISSGNTVIPAGTTARCRNLSKSGFVSNVNFNNATLQVYGNLIYTGGSFTSNAGSSLEFRGTAQQTASGATPLSVTNLLIDNANGLVMSKNITASVSITLLSGKIFTNNFLLTAGTISGANSNRFIVTGDVLNNPATSGGLRMNIASTLSKQFPVGPVNGSYNPCVIENTGGPAEDFTVRVNQNPLAGVVASGAVSRIWQIDESTAGGTTATLTLQWNQSEEGAQFTRNLCGIYKSDGTNIDLAGYSPQNGAATSAGAATWQKQLTGITSFSPWGVINSQTTLPIYLKSFKLKTNAGRNAELSWELEPGSTPAFFELMTSTDGSNYNLLQKIVADQSLSYSYTHERIAAGKIFYKLKITSVDGEIKYSDVLVSESREQKFTELLLYPNPVVNAVNFQINLSEKSKVRLEIYNEQGQKVINREYQLTAGMSIVSVDVSHFAAGTYHAVMVNEQGQREATTFVKTKN